MINNKSKMKRYYFLEKVVTGGSQNLGYSLPDALKNTNDFKELINTIEKDPELNAWVLGDDVKDPTSSSRLAADIWGKLSKTPVGERLLQAYPGIDKYRISSTLARGPGFESGAYDQQREDDPETTRPIDKYDKWANVDGGQTLGNGKMPSFKEYSTNSKWRLPEVQGGAPKGF